MLAGMIFLSSCTAKKCEVKTSPIMPKFPIAGQSVAVELEKIPYEGFEHTWEWLARLRKLQLQLKQ